MPTNRRCPNCYLSQLGVDISESRKSKTEVVNKNFQVYPAYRVTYRPGEGLPDPLSTAGKDALKTFDEYKASDFDRKYKASDFDLVKARHSMCFCSSRGVCHVKAA
jgi:hypothetical protein